MGTLLRLRCEEAEREDRARWPLLRKSSAPVAGGGTIIRPKAPNRTLSRPLDIAVAFRRTAVRTASAPGRLHSAATGAVNTPTRATSRGRHRVALPRRIRLLSALRGLGLC